MSWAHKRQAIILTGLFVLTALFIYGVYAVFIHKAPTCFDNRQDGNEIGIDCGGSCTKICQKSVQQPIVLWARTFKVTRSDYNAVAYIENPNADYGAGLTNYTMTIYGKSGSVITTRTGQTTIPPNKHFAVFEGDITVSSDTPDRVDFQFLGEPSWTKQTPNQNIVVKNTQLTHETTIPRLSASLINNAVTPFSNVEVIAIIYDSKHNAIGVSSTYIDSFPAGATKTAYFTWPASFNGGVTACSKPVDVALLIDRSGSMASDGQNPDEPLTSAKKAADYFIGRLNKDEDQVSIISFANNASNPLDLALSKNIDAAKKAVDAISIGTDGIQDTNIYDGLIQADKQLSSNAVGPHADKVVVVLTDGIPNLPKKVGNTDYPKQVAIEEASILKKKDVTLYTVGLGKAVNDLFLTQLATATKDYLKAPTKDTLNSVYGAIATSLCRRGPRVVEVITRVIPQ